MSQEVLAVDDVSLVSKHPERTQKVWYVRGRMGNTRKIRLSDKLSPVTTSCTTDLSKTRLF